MKRLERSGSLFEFHKWENSLLPFIFKCNIQMTGSEYPINAYTGNWHENIEILRFTSGEGIVYYDGQPISVKEGDIVVINSTAVHFIMTERFVQYDCFIIGMDFCLSNGINPAKRRYSHKISDPELINKMSSIAESAKNKKQEVYVPKARLGVLDLMIYLTEEHSVETDRGNFDIGLAVSIKRALIFINENYGKNITNEQIAAEAGISVYHFIREFKRFTGYTPVVYLNTVRCNAAKKMLAESNVTVSEVAGKCGFDNMSYFSKVFGRYVGCLPSSFKGQINNG